MEGTVFLSHGGCIIRRGNKHWDKRTVPNKRNAVAKKIYSIISVIGAVIAIAAALILFL